jgi:DNA-binding protein YbaB
MFEFLTGSTDKFDMWVAGIDVVENGEEHFNRIEVNGTTKESAESLRDMVLRALNEI